MPKGAFRVRPDKREIVFELALGEEVPSVPDDQARLKDEVEQASTVLRTLFPEGDPRFDEYFHSFVTLAQAGLVGNAQPELATRALASLKNEITAREGGRIKNQYMKALGYPAVAIAILTILVAVILRKNDLLILSNFFFLWSGCMVGVWLSFGARKTFLKFEDLHIPEEDRLEPFVRLFFAGFLTVILGLLFSLKAVTINVGSVSTEQINNSVRIALLLGLICGVSEQALSLKVTQEASRFLDFGKKS